MAVASFYSAAYAALIVLVEGTVPDPTVLGVQMGYIFLVGWLAGLISRETYQQTRAKLEMKELAEASGSMTEDLEIQTVAARAVTAGSHLVGADRGALFLLDRATDELACVYAEGLSEAYLKTVTGGYRQTPCAALFDGEPHVHIPDVHSRDDLGPLGQVMREEEIASYVAVPLTVYGEPMGALVFYRDEVAPFKPEEIELLRSLGSHAASAIENARLVEEVKASEGRWRTLVKHAPNLILLLDREGVIRFINRGIGDIQPEDLMGTRPHEWVPEDHAPMVEENLSAVLERGETRTFEVPGPGSDGERAWYANRAGPILADGEVQAALLISMDITDRKRMEEELRRSNADLEQFAYVASHDLQEPLRMVASYVQLLQRQYKGQLDKDAETYIEYAVDGAQRMQAMIKDLLTYARVDVNEEAFQAVDLETVVDEVVEGLAGMIEQVGATVRRSDLPTVEGVPSQLRQVLQNLLTNALKFHGETAPEISISAERIGQAWQVSVTDNGIGIPEPYMDKIFQLFQRLHTRDKYPGTGIGLAICRKVVQRHGGEIWVEGNEDGGSTFRFTLPIEPEPRGRGRSVGSQQPGPGPGVGNPETVAGPRSPPPMADRQGPSG